MGLDIYLRTDNDSVFHYDEFHKYSLSRTFCNLMCRRDVIENEEPELDQIGQVTGIDISPLYDMNDYPNADAMEYFISSADNEEERQRIIDKAEVDKVKLNTNIDVVLTTISTLIDKLSHINNLQSLFEETANDTINRDAYFRDFNTDTGDGYIGNNFGQDLRNFKNFLDFAKSKGATGVHFDYG